jgi:hypothetical protein
MPMGEAPGCAAQKPPEGAGGWAAGGGVGAGGATGAGVGVGAGGAVLDGAPASVGTSIVSSCTGVRGPCEGATATFSGWPSGGPPH